MFDTLFDTLGNILLRLLLLPLLLSLNLLTDFDFFFFGCYVITSVLFWRLFESRRRSDVKAVYVFYVNYSWAKKTQG